MTRGAGIDAYASRRVRYEYCKWWARDEGDPIPSSILVATKEPDGVFYAKEEAPRYDSQGQTSSVFMVGQSTMTLSTGDCVDGIGENSIVLYDGEEWIVSSVQKRKVKRRSQFSVMPQFVTYLTLRR